MDDKLKTIQENSIVGTGTYLPAELLLNGFTQYTQQDIDKINQVKMIQESMDPSNKQVSFLDDLLAAYETSDARNLQRTAMLGISSLLAPIADPTYTKDYNVLNDEQFTSLPKEKQLQYLSNIKSSVSPNMTSWILNELEEQSL